MHDREKQKAVLLESLAVLGGTLRISKLFRSERRTHFSSFQLKGEILNRLLKTETFRLRLDIVTHLLRWNDQGKGIRSENKKPF